MEFIKQKYSPKRHRFCLTQQIIRNMNQPRMSQGRTGNIPDYTGGTETIVRNIYSYQVPAMVGTDASTNENNKLYNSIVQAISRGGGDCTTKVGALCARFVDMGDPVKTEVENGGYRRAPARRAD